MHKKVPYPRQPFIPRCRGCFLKRLRSFLPEAGKASVIFHKKEKKYLSFLLIDMEGGNGYNDECKRLHFMGLFAQFQRKGDG